MKSVTAASALVAALLALPLIASCGGGEADSADTDTAVTTDTAGATTPGAGAAAEPADRPLAVADIEAYERGLRAELEAVNKAIKDKAAAKPSTATPSAMMAAMDQQTVDAGARAAGVSVDRYSLRMTLVGTRLKAAQ